MRFAKLDRASRETDIGAYARVTYRTFSDMVMIPGITKIISIETREMTGNPGAGDVVIISTELGVFVIHPYGGASLMIDCPDRETTVTIGHLDEYGLEMLIKNRPARLKSINRYYKKIKNPSAFIETAKDDFANLTA